MRDDRFQPRDDLGATREDRVFGLGHHERHRDFVLRALLVALRHAAIAYGLQVAGPADLRRRFEGLSRAMSDMKDPHHAGDLVDLKDDAVDVSSATMEEMTKSFVLRRRGTALGVRFETEDRVLRAP